MKKKIAVLCPSEIAFRRFMPSLLKHPNFQYVGIAHANEKEWFGNDEKSHNQDVLEQEKGKAQKFLKTYGGCIFDSYQALLQSDDVDAIYLPLPPALHYQWGKAVLEHGKHLLMEKPFTTSLQETKVLTALADQNGVAVHENYMFVYHSQLDFIQQMVDDKRIGELRLIRITFGFPFRGGNDFRYCKALGGGALLDCGGYTVKLATLLLGDTARLTTSRLNTKKGFEVDLFGSATMVNDAGLTAQLSFGMDNNYKCELELWGSEGTLYTNRILTAPEGFLPAVTIKSADGEKSFQLPADDSFEKSIDYFYKCTQDQSTAREQRKKILHQAEIVEMILRG